MNSYNLYKQYFVLRPAWQPTIGNDTKIYTTFSLKFTFWQTSDFSGDQLRRTAYKIMRLISLQSR